MPQTIPSSIHEPQIGFMQDNDIEGNDNNEKDCFDRIRDLRVKTP